MNKQGYGDSPYCCFHPRELVVGVCPHCLKARLLLLLAAKDDPAQALLRRRRRSRTSSISLPKVFALGSSFLLQRLDSRGHHYTHRSTDAADTASAAVPNPNLDDGNCSDDTTTSVASLDDSFISIKFEDNGKATWDSPHKQQQVVIATTKTTKQSNGTVQAQAVMVAGQHAKRGGVTRWRKQVVGRLLQLARWKQRSTKAGAAATAACMDGKKPAVSRGRPGWIRSLTRRRADRAWS